MEILSFLLGIAGDVAKTWLIDLVREKRVKTTTEQQAKMVKAMVESELRAQAKTSDISTDVLAKQVIDQIVLMSQDPLFPISVMDGKIVLKTPPQGKPLIGSSEKWAEKEIAARLYQLDSVIKERQKELGALKTRPDDTVRNGQGIQVKSKLPPLDNKKEVGGNDVWREKLERTAEQIEKRRRIELRPVVTTTKTKDDSANTHS